MGVEFVPGFGQDFAGEFCLGFVCFGEVDEEVSLL